MVSMSRRRELRVRAGAKLGDSGRDVTAVDRIETIRARTKHQIRVEVDRPTAHVPSYPIPRRAGAAVVSWSYGLTTVPSRVGDLLPRTLDSLAAGGFHAPRLFVDGADHQQISKMFEPMCSSRGLTATYRTTPVKTAGNWALSLGELYLLNPHADLYALFQDDFVTCRNLRAYLEQTLLPADGYYNLYTFPKYQAACNNSGWNKTTQQGLGAVALVFRRETVVDLLSSRYMVERPQDRERGWQKIDGGIVDALRLTKTNFEYVHDPSLVQHTGLESSMGNRRHALARSFPGEKFDALTLLG